MAIQPISAVGAEQTLPDPQGMVAAIARYGYSLADALADLVDNSLDAGAENVLVRFLRDEHAIQRIVVADDGAGMDEDLLRLAMQFGVRLDHDRTDLGKYGLGLKSASFSQCRSVSVVTHDRGGWVGGRRWTIELIERGWICELLDASECAALLGADWSPVATRRSGTLIVWDELDRLKLGRAGVDAALQGFMKRIPIALGIVFHRFLGDDRLRLALDSENIVTGQRSPVRMVEALDPFAYKETGRIGYPLNFDVPLEGGTSLSLRAHIWPPNSKDPAYRLGGGRIAERQGFYFYRNDRVIQAGGWNGWRGDSEPHLSLARASVELPAKLDSKFRLDVKKSLLDAPPEFINALDAARAGSTKLTDWTQSATETYRKSDVGARRSAPLIPGTGVPVKIRRIALKNADLTKVKEPREVSFDWCDFDDDAVFEIDRESATIRLNRAYRTEILQGTKASGADAPVVKVLLYLLLRGELDHQRSSASREKMLSEANMLLREAARLQSW